jgi:uncharacterized damage-inducible protein DinB
MSIAEDFISELSYELPATRKLLARIPAEKGPWKPHPKSSAFGHLAQLVARLPGVMAQIVEGLDLDLAAGPPYSFEPTEALLKLFDENAARAARVLHSAADADFAPEWRLLYGGQVLDTGRRKDVLRNTINHFVHRRAQLTVYLRMNEIPVPCLYGPTADEQP